MGEIKITLNSTTSSSISPVIYWMNLLLENTNTTTLTMPMVNKSSDPVFTKTMNPRSARPKAINPNLSLDIYSPPDIETSPERKRGLPE